MPRLDTHPGRDRRAKPTYATPGMARAVRLRAYFAGLVLTAGLVGVTYRAWQLQVEQGETFRRQAARQHAATVAIPPPRGPIFDRRGRSLAVSADIDSAWANPREVKDVSATAEALAHVLELDARVLEAKLAKDARFTWLARHLAPELALKVRALKLAGIYVTPESRRWYPNQTVGGPVVGRADIDGRGLEGIELTFDQHLRGERTQTTALRDARGRTVYTDGLPELLDGAAVHSTLDSTIQAIADRALAEAVVAHKAQSGVAIVLEVGTSNVLALANYPTFDPNSNDPHGGARNRAVTDVYEIGSVMKVFTVAAALEARATRADELWNVEHGAYRVGPKTIRDVHPDPALTTSEIIKRSSNVGAVKIAQRLGRERLYEGLRRLGFAARTGIELPGERTGTLRKGATWREIELATIAFGYGLTVTPLQMAAAMATIGNHGRYVPPRIVDRVVSADGQVVYASRRLMPDPSDGTGPRQALSPEVADAMLPMLASVFEPGKHGGTAGSIVVPGFRCGGKTGTAHKMDPTTKTYSPDKYYSSFAGLAPIDNPQLAIVVIIDEPSGGDYFGGKVAGPVFATIASEALRYLGVPGSAIAPPALPDDANTPPPAPVAPAIEVDEPADFPANTAPNLVGLPLAKALNVARTRELRLHIAEDDGTPTTTVIVSQDPLPGMPVDETVEVVLTPAHL